MRFSTTDTWTFCFLAHVQLHHGILSSMAVVPWNTRNALLPILGRQDQYHSAPPESATNCLNSSTHIVRFGVSIISDSDLGNEVQHKELQLFCNGHKTDDSTWLRGKSLAAAIPFILSEELPTIE